MSQATPQERLQALEKWCLAAAAKGHKVPSKALIKMYADAGQAMIWEIRKSDDETVNSWMPTLEFFAKQWSMGVNMPVPSTALMSPAVSDASVKTPKPAPSSADNSPSKKEAPTVNDLRFEALKERLRDELSVKDDKGLVRLKESHLKSIARTEFVTADEIASMLPAAAKEYAIIMATVLAALSGKPNDQVPEADTVERAPKAPIVQESAGKVSSTVDDSHAADESTRSSSSDVKPEGFAPFNFNAASNEVGVVRGYISPESALVLSWDEYRAKGQTVIYRVVASDDYAPYNPDQATLICATTKLTASDGRPYTSAIRYIQVWINVGASVSEAKSNQPLLHAQQSFVAPPRDVEIREDEGRVIGQWTVWPGTSRVQVYRVPIERVALEAGAPQHRILESLENMGGFVDGDAARGSRYLYQVKAEAAEGTGIKLSQPVDVVLLISDIIEPVEDLVVSPHGDGKEPRFDLTWTAPTGGKVFIYRTELPPTAGADRATRPESVLASAKLAPEDRLAHPIDRLANGQHTMHDVPWPRDWTRAYFTPVTVLNSQALVGKTVPMVYVQSIEAAKIVERVNKQVLTFSWPPGVSSVLVYESAIGAPLEAVLESSTPIEITAEQYVQNGGLHFPRLLPSSKGCTVHLVPVAFQAGERVLGPSSSVNYSKLLRITYSSKIRRNKITGTATGVTVTIKSDVPVASCPEFVLVHNHERMPLSRADGKPLSLIPELPEGTPASRRIMLSGLTEEMSSPWKTHPDAWKSEVPTSSGYVRLFADLPPEMLEWVAVLDPAPSSLRLSKSGRAIW